MGCCHLCDKNIQRISNKEFEKNNFKDSKKLIIKDSKGQNMLTMKILSGDDSFDEYDDENDEIIIDDSYQNNYEYNQLNSRILTYIFGQKSQEQCREFLSIFQTIYQLSFELTTTYYTLSFKNVKNLIEDFKQKQMFVPVISDKLYSFIINNKTKIEEYDDKDIYKIFDVLFLSNPDFQIEIIKSALCFCMDNNNFNSNNISYSFVKLFQDIGFCIRIFYCSLNAHIYNDRYAYEYEFDIRILYYCNLIQNVVYNFKYPSHLMQLAKESSRVKDTIILGDKQFRNNIKGLNLPSERINELEDNMLDSFFQKPYIEKKKYKIVKYFVICQDEKLENNYLEKFKELSSKYGFSYLFLVYVKNKKLTDIKDSLKKLESIYYFFDSNELIEIYKDNNERLTPLLAGYLPENENFPELKKAKDELNEINNERFKDLKYSSEEGWDLFEFNKNNYHSGIDMIAGCFHNVISHIIGHFIESYKERNALEIFFKYYSNYFFLTLQPEFLVNMTAYAKMFLYAYTLEEGDPKKNLYCILNNDLRSSDGSKINRHQELIKLIGGLIQAKKLKCYNEKLYRATFLKDELIKKLKVGLIMVNSAFWSATKKESVAKQFLKQSYKNALIITKGGLENNIDIHLEKMSRYPNEEEVLFLPFCNFKIISFDKVKEGNLSYYKIFLESASDSSLIEPYEKNIIKKFEFEKTKYD